MMSSSRLIVKNLPKTVNEQKLKDHFGQKGEVTDVQLKYAGDGKFRHFAFVGFKREDAASEAQQYFDKTYMGTTKITVELCHSLSDKPRSASRVIREQERLEKLKQKAKSQEKESTQPKRKKKEDEILERCDEDPNFLEFLQAHKKAAATWGNDSIVDELKKLKQKQDDAKRPKEQSKKRKSPGDEELVDNQIALNDAAITTTEAETVDKTKKKRKKKEKLSTDFFTIKLRDVPKKAKKPDVKAFFAPLKLKSIRFPKGIRGIVYVGFATSDDMVKGLQKNKSFLLGNQIRLHDYSKGSAPVEEKPKGKFEQMSEQLEQQAEPVGESGRIFLRNLSYSANEEEMTKLFEQFGPVSEIHLPIDKITRKLKGFGFVSFMLPEHADKAYTALRGTVFQGRMLHLLPAKAKYEPVDEEAQAGSSFKTAKEQKLKKTAGSSHNWNALFLGTSAISKVISEKYGISREELLLEKTEENDSRLASVGVRMALAETEVVAETKKFLEDHGVSLEAFESTVKKPERSKTVILAKNLPAYTSANDLTDLFVKFGVLNRVVVPPFGITGLVEFAEPAEARVAFKKLAYSKCFNVPLYLEWAPVGVFTRPADSAQIVRVESKPNLSIQSKAECPEPAKEIEKLFQAEDFEPVDENAVPELDTTLFVKNLNFRTRDEALKKHFVQYGPIYAVTIAMKKDPSNPDIVLSMGYGFVQFYRTKDASKALTSLQGTMLENHLLEIKPSSRTLMKETAHVKESSNGTKILVRNVPFLATQDEISDLFKTFGKTKAVRMPKKMTGSGEHRGFAFIEYYSESDAKKAFDTLCKSTHLYGRRLVLEWAAQEESIDDLRAKTARLSNKDGGFRADGEEGGSTKKRLSRYFQTHGSAKPSAEGSDEEDD